MRIELFNPLSFIQIGKRDNQEDARCPDIDCMDSSQRFFVVCDGVGGADYGEMASTTVCEAIQKAMRNIDLSDDFTNEMFSGVLDAAYDQLDKKAKTASYDMSTTLSFLCFHGQGCTMAHIGDSRIYQFRPGIGIIYKSDDHSLVNNMVRNGMLSPDEAENHPQANVITRCMKPVRGMENRSQATVVRNHDIRTGDYFLLCSDGVLNCIDDDHLVDLLLQTDTDDEEKMLRLAQITQGSVDNNTAILVHVKSVDGKEEIDILSDADNDDLDTNAPGQSPTCKFSKRWQENTEIESHKKEKKSLLGKIKDFFLA